MHQQCAKAHHRMQVAVVWTDRCRLGVLAEGNQQITGADMISLVHSRESGLARARIHRPLAISCADTAAHLSAHAILSWAAVRALCYRV